MDNGNNLFTLGDNRQLKVCLSGNCRHAMLLVMSIAERIKAARESLGWSQTELARRLGVSKTAVSKWEDGQTAPKRKRAEAVAKALGSHARSIIAVFATAFERA